MTRMLEWLNAMVWGAPTLVLILGVGLFLTIRLGAAQITLFPRALRQFAARLRPEKGSMEGTSSFQALCTALAATVGTGNLVGVAGAICLGGPGAIFWMWIGGLAGMATKYAEATLAVRYRVKGDSGWLGGPMYVMLGGLGESCRPLARLYCLFGVIASFGVGNAAQVNAAITGVNAVLSHFGREQSSALNFLMGIVLVLILGPVLLGGAKRLGAAAERLVPLAAGGYILLCAGVLLLKSDQIPAAFSAIVTGAVSPRAVTGGVLGSAFQALRVGCSRGVFTNEAGMGTAAIAHGSAQVSHPAEQGLMGIVEVFLDTIVICTLTALVILVSGVPVPYGKDAGGRLTTQAFSAVYGEGAALAIAAALVLFAAATVLGWSLYGIRCAVFLFGSEAGRKFLYIQMAVLLLSSVLDTATVWLLSEAVNGLMAIPNLITLVALVPELSRLTKEYKISGALDAGGGNYADFHQRKPLRTFSYEKVPPSGSGSKKRGKENLSSEHWPA